MKKMIFYCMILYLALGVPVFADRSMIDDFFESYETLVLEIEEFARQLSQRKPIEQQVNTNILNSWYDKWVSQLEKSRNTITKFDAIITDEELTLHDIQRITDLQERQRKAMELQDSHLPW
jgi:hypothetical protein